MSRIAYVNGRYLPHQDAAVHVEDRGYQFADGVYEVIAVHKGKLVDGARHMQRLHRSLKEIQIPSPMADTALLHIMQETIRRNSVQNGIVYLQVTRGVAPRDHKFPKNATPSVVVTAKRIKPTPLALLETGVSVITVPDIRWLRRDVKSISLLPNCLGKQQAAEASAHEAWLVDSDGYVTEGTSTNAWIVDAKGVLRTRKVSHVILNGITRMALVEIAATQGIPFDEKPFTVDEAKTAREAFISSTLSFVLPVTSIDKTPVGKGVPGPVAQALRQAYVAQFTPETI
ncbi:MAG: D-amino-acid transaminase [Alphaproteobacteria bacterium]